jgi:predicted glutamine amidotransferase
VIVSEPLDHDRKRWTPVPPGRVVIARSGHPVEVLPFLDDLQVAAE